MLITKVHKRYAKSLLGFSREMGKMEEVRQDVEQMLAAIEESREFRVMLKSPVITPDKKEKIMDAIFEGQFTEITSKFIKILIRKGREGSLEETMRAFINQYRDVKGIEEAVITTAGPLSDEQRGEIKQKLADITSRQIVMVEKVDPEIIGGLKVKVGDHLYNGSIARQLEQLRREFKKNTFVADF